MREEGVVITRERARQLYPDWAEDDTYFMPERDFLDLYMRLAPN